MVPTPPRIPTPSRARGHSLARDRDGHPDEITDELAYVRPADADERDPSRRARRASQEAVAYLSARRRRLRQRLHAEEEGGSLS